MSPQGLTRFSFGRRLCLDFTWTLAQRLWAPTELLTSDADVAAWLVAAGVPQYGVAAQSKVLASARDLREAIYRSVHRRIADEDMEEGDIAAINRWAGQSRFVPTLDAHGSVTWTSSDPLGAGLAEIATDAVLLLATSTNRLRECSRDGCGRLYVDVSPAGQRRWCSVERCGNAVNTARYRRRSTSR